MKNFFKKMFNIVFRIYLILTILAACLIIVAPPYTGQNVLICSILLGLIIFVLTIITAVFKFSRKRTILMPVLAMLFLFLEAFVVDQVKSLTSNVLKSSSGGYGTPSYGGGDSLFSYVFSTASEPQSILGDFFDSFDSSQASNSSGGATGWGVGYSNGPIIGSAPRSGMVIDSMDAEITADNSKYTHTSENPVKVASAEPISTFSIDVDTSSYANVRAYLNDNDLPPKDAVRVEEMINYFPYDYELPAQKTEPFAIHATLTQSPWSKGNQLLHIGIKGYEDITDTDKPLNLVLLIDTSGSMDGEDRLGLLQDGFNMLVDKLSSKDTISIVTYAGSSEILLPPTSGAKKSKIKSAIRSLSASGGTYGEDGLKTAYKLAKDNYDSNAINRILLGTDGDFNIGNIRDESLTDYVARQSKNGIYLSILNVGRNNYNDALMQSLAQSGNGVGYYLDSIIEAKRVLSDDIKKTLFPIANDVKIQVEFNPNKVSEYRLIGYETRLLNQEDFNNDKVDAGDINAGHSVTAIYEITPTTSENRMIDDLRYGQKTHQTLPVADSTENEVAFVKIRYKLPNEKESKLITQPVVDVVNLENTSDDIRFSIAVAGFSQVLKDSKFVDWNLKDIRSFAKEALGEDEYDYRLDFLSLIKKAEALQLTE